MTRVALVKGEDRRANVRRALELIEGDIELEFDPSLRTSARSSGKINQVFYQFAKFEVQ